MSAYLEILIHIERFLVIVALQDKKINSIDSVWLIFCLIGSSLKLILRGRQPNVLIGR